MTPSLDAPTRSAKPQRTSSPRILIVRVLEACNAGCFMCEFAHSRDGFRFSAADGRKLAETTQGRIRLVRFTGGEPLIHDQLPAIVAGFDARDIETSIITNGAFLADRCDELVTSGLSQVIVSLDGPDSATHDRFRQTPGLFDQALVGLARLRENAPDVRTRVNTVAGPHNVAHLVEMHRLLSELGVQDWSIIPLKTSDGPYRYPRPDRSLEQYREFQAALSVEVGPRLIGYSRTWMGADDADVRSYMSGAPPRTPSGPCRVVDVLRYYTPRSGEVFPCNCVPHRTAGVDLAMPWRDDLEGGRATTWLRAHGPLNCTGCEPANAALGDAAIDLDDDVFGF